MRPPSATSLSLPLPREKRLVSPLEAWHENETAKRARRGDAESSAVSATEAVREQALHIADDIIDAFNLCDATSLYRLMRERCAEDVQLRYGQLQCPSFRGARALFGFWNIAHETYPDAIIRILERRVISEPRSCLGSVDGAATDNNNTAAAPLRVEIVYKFTGTRITSKTVFEAFAEFMQRERGFMQDELSLTGNDSSDAAAATQSSCEAKNTLEDPLSSTITNEKESSVARAQSEGASSACDGLTLAMVRFITSSSAPPAASLSAAAAPPMPPSSSSSSSSAQCEEDKDRIRNYIMEAVLDLDGSSGKIRHWQIDALAADDC